VIGTAPIIGYVVAFDPPPAQRASENDEFLVAGAVIFLAFGRRVRLVPDGIPTKRAFGNDDLPVAGAVIVLAFGRLVRLVPDGIPAGLARHDVVAEAEPVVVLAVIGYEPAFFGGFLAVCTYYDVFPKTAAVIALALVGD